MARFQQHPGLKESPFPPLPQSSPTVSDPRLDNNTLRPFAPSSTFQFDFRAQTDHPETVRAPERRSDACTCPSCTLPSFSPSSSRIWFCCLPTPISPSPLQQRPPRSASIRAHTSPNSVAGLPFLAFPVRFRPLQPARPVLPRLSPVLGFSLALPPGARRLDRPLVVAQSQRPCPERT